MCGFEKEELTEEKEGKIYGFSWEDEKREDQADEAKEFRGEEKRPCEC